MFIEKLVGKNLSISSKNLGFRMIFKLVTESIFEQTYTFCVSIWVFLLDMIKVCDKKVISFFLIFSCYIYKLLFS